MKKMKKHMYVSLALVAIVTVQAYALDPTAQSPIVSPIVSPTASQAPYINPQPEAGTYNYYGRHSNLRGRLPNNDLSRFQEPGGFVPYNSIDNLSDTNRRRSIRSLLQRAASRYYPNTQTSTSIGNLGPTGLEHLRPALSEKADIYNPAAIYDDLNIFKLRHQRPMATEIDEIDAALERNIRLLELRELYGDLPLEQGLLKEPIRKTNPDITELLKIQQPMEPQQPGDIFEPKQKRTDVKETDIYDSLIDEMESEKQKKPEQQKLPEQPTTEKSKYKFDIPKRQPLPKVDHEQALKIRGEHKTFDNLAKTNKAEYMEIANKMLVAGKFYKAADACTLATVWMPEDAEPFMVKGLALFGAGEYMSSSFYIQQAIEMKPEYASEMIGLEEKLTDIDLIDDRMVEATEWQKQAKSPEIAFLIAFIIYQQDNFIGAAEMIGRASTKMGDNPAVKALQKAIEEANDY